MKNKIKKWLGVTDLEKTVGKRKKQTESWFGFSLLDTFYWEHDTLVDRVQSLEEKVTALEKLLKVTYVQKTEEVKEYQKAKK